MTNTMTLLPVVTAIMLLACTPGRAVAQRVPTTAPTALVFGKDPGPAAANIDGHRLVLQNALLAATWEMGGSLKLVRLEDRIGSTLIRPVDGQDFASGLRLIHGPVLQRIAANARSVRICERFGGWQAVASLVSADGSLRVEWKAVLRDGSNYIRQEWMIRAEGKEFPAAALTLLRLDAPGAKAAGAVDGSPIVAGGWFIGCEHPMASNRVDGNSIVGSVGTLRLLRAGESCSRSCVIGVGPAGQMRRAFLHYLERERPRPYRPFLHYNSWYDIAWGDRKMDEPKCLTVIDLYARELIAKRGVTLDSFVFDDGWDDNKTLWRFHDRFPHGFEPLRQAAEKNHSSIGVWLSPWGGYGQAKEERLRFGKTQGFEINRQGFSLAGPKYYARFRDVCLEMIDKYDVNYFKFDGIAQGISSGGAGVEFATDVDGLLRLMGDLRARRPDVFINVTTGTWPSPFWLLWADSIWRNGGDMGFDGPGSKRQQWITYRDMIEHNWIVRRAELYPLNSLMTQGVAQARLGDASKLGSDLKEFKDEVRSFFASGTQTQELYITPQMLSPEMWDALAEAANWSRKNADVLADVHWIGGDPAKRQIYGFAAWSPRAGMIALRNPSDQPGSLAVHIGEAFQLPTGAAQEYRLGSPWRDQAAQGALTLRADKPHTFALEPFQVLVLQAAPAAAKGSDN